MVDRDDEDEENRFIVTDDGAMEVVEWEDLDHLEESIDRELWNDPDDEDDDED